MKKHYVNILKRRFPRKTSHEVEQAIAMAEAKTTEARLAWHIARTTLMCEMRGDIRRDAHLTSYDDPTFDGDLLVGDDIILDLYFAKQEWSAILRGLPPPSRMLAEIAKRDAETFENVEQGLWTRANLTELRRRIKRDFIARDKAHSERAYYRAKNDLVLALRRDRRHKRNRERTQCAYSCTQVHTESRGGR